MVRFRDRVRFKVNIGAGNSVSDRVRARVR